MVRNKKPSIILLSETHLTNDIEDSEVNIRGYKIIRCDSTSRHTGGVAIYSRDNLNINIVHKENYVNTAWTLSVKIISKSIFGVFSVIYRSPSTSEALFIDYFKKWFDKYINHELLTVIAGDFNINLMKNEFYSEKMKSVLKSLGMKQFINEPTRITKNSKTLIDYVISNRYKMKVKVLLNEKISDHSTIICDFEKKCESNGRVENKQKIINYSKEVFIDNLTKIEWTKAFKWNVNEKANFLVSNIKDCLAQFVKNIIVKPHNSQKWYNQDLFKLRNKRDNAFKTAVLTDDQANWIKYNEINILYKMKTKATKNNYYKNKLYNARDNQKKTWQVLKEIVNGTNDNSNSYIEFNGVKVSDTKLIINNFNHYYVDSIIEINNSIPNQSELDFINMKMVENDFKFNPVNYDDIISVIKGIRCQSDCELLNKTIILDALTFIGLPFLDVINSSLESGLFPTDWKISILTPVPKVQNTVKAEEFRPINQLPTYEKILEGVVKRQLNEHLEKNEILISEQFGFRKRYSCEMAINVILLNWKEEIDCGKRIIAVFLDLKRAFETINRERLIKKMEQYGVRGLEKRWFESYLTNRFQQTKMNAEISDILEVKLGVPQGAKLAADLFILYINDINQCLKYCKIALFADDCLIYIIDTDTISANTKINEDLGRINKWLNANKLKLNISKTKCMLINREKDLNEDDITIKINADEIEKVNSIKYLGMIIDDHLKMSEHVEYIIKKVSKKIGFLGRISRKLPLGHRITLYKTIIAPHFEYCSSVLYMCNKGEFEKLQKQQNRAMRIILRCSYITSVDIMLETLAWMSIRQRIVYNTLIYIFKIRHNILPKVLCDKIHYVSDRHNYPVRSADDFSIYRTKKTSTKNSIFYNGLQQFNGLPDEIKKEKNLSSFKKLLSFYIKCNVNIKN